MGKHGSKQRVMLVNENVSLYIKIIIIIILDHVTKQKGILQKFTVFKILSFSCLSYDSFFCHHPIVLHLDMFCIT